LFNPRCPEKRGVITEGNGRVSRKKKRTRSIASKNRVLPETGARRRAVRKKKKPRQHCRELA